MMSLCARRASGERPKRYDIKFTTLGARPYYFYLLNDIVGTTYYRYIIILLLYPYVHHDRYTTIIKRGDEPILYVLLNRTRREPSR